MITSLEYPNKWKRSQISHIPKISMASQYKDYQPISVLFQLWKLAEDVIISTIKPSFNEHVGNTVNS